MIYGNHNKRKGDIVQIARWEQAELERAQTWYNSKPWTIDDVKFIVTDIDYYHRKIRLLPKNPNFSVEGFVVSLDATSLIKVGSLADEK